MRGFRRIKRSIILPSRDESFDTCSARITFLIVTHFHPDHAGNSGWICERWNLRPWMTQAEWLTAQLAAQDRRAGDPAQRMSFYAGHGLSEADQTRMRERGSRYGDGVRLPNSFRRMVDGERIRIGAHDWEVIVGRGHSPEHASLHCPALGLFIAGDQLLPEITTNVSVWPDEPDADSLGQFIDSLQHFARVLPAQTLVLPAHRRPFRGVQARVAQILHHHRERLDQLLSVAQAAPVSVGELLRHLFRGDLDGHQLVFAMGEALAHVNYLEQRGALRRRVEDGFTRYERSGALPAGSLPGAG